MRKLKFIVGLLVTLTAIQASGAGGNKNAPQSNDSTNVREYDFSLEYGSTRLYRGIKSTSKPYLKPSFLYSAPKGFYAGVASYLSVDSSFAIDETDFNLGYDIYFSKHTEGSIELTHFFVENKQLANASIKNELEFTVSHRFGKILNTKIYFDSEFGSGSTDHALTLDNSHDFIFYDAFAEDDKFTIQPSFSLSAGTLNLAKKVRKEITNAGFGLTNYDVALSACYETGSFVFEVALDYDVPSKKKFPVLSKLLKLEPVLYFTASITYIID